MTYEEWDDARQKGTKDRAVAQLFDHGGDDQTALATRLAPMSRREFRAWTRHAKAHARTAHERENRRLFRGIR